MVVAVMLTMVTGIGQQVVVAAVVHIMWSQYQSLRDNWIYMWHLSLRELLIVVMVVPQPLHITEQLIFRPTAAYMEQMQTMVIEPPMEEQVVQQVPILGVMEQKVKMEVVLKAVAAADPRDLDIRLSDLTCNIPQLPIKI